MRNLQARFLTLAMILCLGLFWADMAQAEQDVRARALVTANLTMTQATGNEVFIGNITGNITITLPPSPRTGQVINIDDAYGDVATDGNVSIKGATGNINGVNNITLSTAYGGKRCVYTGTQWVAR